MFKQAFFLVMYLLLTGCLDVGSSGSDAAVGQEAIPRQAEIGTQAVFWGSGPEDQQDPYYRLEKTTEQTVVVDTTLELQAGFWEYTRNGWIPVSLQLSDPHRLVESECMASGTATLFIQSVTQLDRVDSVHLEYKPSKACKNDRITLKKNSQQAGTVIGHYRIPEIRESGFALF